jgi:solute carrier family 25 carnitine/acylcarnitine transporter 20/29
MTGDDNNSSTTTTNDNNNNNKSNDNNDKPPRVPQDTLKIFTCGSAAGALQAFVICPMEHIKCRLQIQSLPTTATTTPKAANAATTTNSATKTKPIHRPQPAGPIELTKSIIKHHGLFHGLYRGMGVTLWRETPAFGMYFATYDAIKERVEQVLDDSNASHPIPSHAHAWAASALAGGISGAWTWVIIYPFDVIKTCIQTSALDKQLQKSMWTVGYELIVEHGWKHMFRGLGVTLVRAFPVNAIIFPTYEFVLLQLGDGR